MSQQAEPTLRATAFERFAGGCAIAVGISGLVYSLAFILVVRTRSEAAALLTWGLLLITGFLSTAVMVALYRRLREIEAGFALWGLLLGTAGAVGSAIHGGFELGRALTPRAGGGATSSAPNVVDPRGLLTFGLAGAAVLAFSWLIRRGGGLPKGLAWLGFAFGALLLLVYLGRLVILDASNPVLLGTAAVAGVLAHPAWFIWLGASLVRR